MPRTGSSLILKIFKYLELWQFSDSESFEIARTGRYYKNHTPPHTCSYLNNVRRGGIRESVLNITCCSRQEEDRNGSYGNQEHYLLTFSKAQIGQVCT
jgi:hypothetical protein